MVKSMYHYLKQAWKKPSESEQWQSRLMEWRRDNAIKVIDRPTRLDRARNLGYKAKKGFLVVRVRLNRGGRKRPKRRKGRRSKRQTIRQTLKMSYKWVAEIRAENKFDNMVVLNSYWVAQDGKHYWFEVILVDPSRPEIANDPKMKWICNVKGRAVRGLTSAAKKSKEQGKH